nr:AAA family ATPase [Clostridia bacterium]
MLIKVSVENFKSFDQLTELTMVSSSKIQSFEDHKIKIKGTTLLKNAVVYGANASGKSNLIEFFSFFKSCLTDGMPIDYSRYFCKIKKENETRESSFEIQFSVNGAIYAYGFSAILSQRQITAEWLYELHATTEPKLLFERDKMGVINVAGLKLPSAERIRMQTYMEDFDGNTSILFLSEMNRNKKFAEKSKLIVFKKVYSWLQNNIIVFKPNDPITNFEYYYDHESLEQINNLIETFDTGITDVRIEEISIEELKHHLPQEVFTEIMSRLKQRLTEAPDAHHRMSMRSETSFFSIEVAENEEPRITTIRSHHGKSFFDFAFEDESDGTRRLFDLLDMLLIKNEDIVFVVDELERSLHPKLTQHFLKMFSNRHAKRQIQLLFTTHEASIMDQDMFRRDEIWFVERSADNVSSIYSLDRFKERYDKVLSKAYLDGRYGAIPVFSSFAFGEEE